MTDEATVDQLRNLCELQRLEIARLNANQKETGVEVNFKFEIGEIVLLKLRVAESSLEIGRRPSLLTVLERHTQECPGGTQIHYTLVGGDRQDVFRANEIEVCKLSDFDFVAAEEAAWKRELGLMSEREAAMTEARDRRRAELAKKREAQTES